MGRTDKDGVRWRYGWLACGVAALMGTAVWFLNAPHEETAPSANQSPAAAEPPEHSLTLADLFAFARTHRSLFLGEFATDDSGFNLGLFYLPRPIQDPTSLASIRDAYARSGYRGIEIIERALAREDLLPDHRLEALIMKAQLSLYEGEFAKASATLDQARALIGESPVRLSLRLPELIFLQAIAALRRGETENCIECTCEFSCIFPLAPQVVHQKRAGSMQAVGYLTEFLQHRPDDMGACWLLNLAYMTLGQYPDQVPPRYLIPLAPFQSEIDIGRFRDIAPQLGVNRLNLSGGAILDDFDNDGLLDLVTTTINSAEPMAFYRNRGDGTFEDRTKAAGLEQQLGGLYCVQTDYNNDGWLDIFICRGAWTRRPHRLSLLRNNQDGTFTDVTREAGLLTPVSSQVAAWADYDNDGWLDLFVGGESGRSFLYRNRGDGTFEEVAVRAGVANPGMIVKGAAWGDIDGDGFPDLYVANLMGPPRLFRNNRDGTFTEVAAQMGITKPYLGFSCWFWDYDNDGWLDLFAAGYERSLSKVIRSHLGQPHQGEACRLYRNRAGRGFEDVTEAIGLDLALAPMGSNFADFDNDGFLDFYLATGTPAYSMLVPNRMFKNVEGQRFVDITTSSGTGHLQKGHGVACGDWDRDGNVDLFVELGGATPGDRFRNVFFQNPGQGNHWITVRLVGQKTNRPGIGARIKVLLPGPPERAIYRHVTSGSSFGANPLQQTIGIGKADKIAALEVYWPTSGTTQIFRDVAIDQAIEVTEFAPDYRRLNWTRIPVPR